LLTDTFHANRWDYLYSIQPGGGQRLHERVSVNFNADDQLVGLSGDFMPGVSRDQAILGEDSGVTTPQTTKQPKAEEKPAPGSLLEQIQREVDDVKVVPVPVPEPLESTPQ
nr:outer membrane protein assembly factor BamE [Pseudomonas sp.]